MENSSKLVVLRIIWVASSLLCVVVRVVVRIFYWDAYLVLTAFHRSFAERGSFYVDAIGAIEPVSFCVEYCGDLALG